MIYYIYHIPGVKIGVTKDLYDRMRHGRQRNLDDNNYEILEEHTDLETVSLREIELQKQYGYRVDRNLYKDIIDKPKRGSRALTFEQAQEIRSKYIPRVYTIPRLAREYGVTFGAINAILKNRTYIVQ